ncbi:ABC transporter ATP-binding protein [Halosquirtibacter laminarini]|uniref:ABC transporter ATP-binding protein n=1 Tax=Halosquirtibacter laminarini TaxID=3374600 RepID=A0AC61NP65_9BACT|nr:ABC transporter ATP-binding protein [Prolixibacteraceae bacterium]
MIKLRNIHKSYSSGNANLHVLKGIDLEVKEGEMVSIMGASGSGKSTLLNMLGILDKYDKGEYQLDGINMNHLSEKEEAFYRNRKLGFIFQDASLITYKNALENVALPLYYQNISMKKRNKIALEYLDKVGLTEWAHHLPSELSGGQRQRVAIARALICNPQVILADEPTGQLDSSTSLEIMELLKKINNDGITVIIITHEHDIAEMTNRIVYIKDGVIE